MKLNRDAVNRYNRGRTTFYRDTMVRRIIRIWAIENGLKCSMRGKLSESVVMDWIEAHNEGPMEVVSSTRYFYYGKIHTQIKILCTRCADYHLHGGLPAQRGDLGSRAYHCTDPYGQAYETRSGYQIVDNRPILNWELEAVKQNEA